MQVCLVKYCNHIKYQLLFAITLFCNLSKINWFTATNIQDMQGLAQGKKCLQCRGSCEPCRNFLQANKS